MRERREENVKRRKKGERKEVKLSRVLLEPLVQADVVAAMGTTVDTIMENLQDLDSAVSSF